jgi:hypothetical protein
MKSGRRNISAFEQELICRSQKLFKDKGNNNDYSDLSSNE